MKEKLTFLQYLPASPAIADVAVDASFAVVAVDLKLQFSRLLSMLLLLHADCCHAAFRTGVAVDVPTVAAASIGVNAPVAAVLLITIIQ
jgi:hypothetical protein